VIGVALGPVGSKLGGGFWVYDAQKDRLDLSIKLKISPTATPHSFGAPMHPELERV
jgi:hypothetical protein